MEKVLNKDKAIDDLLLLVSKKNKRIKKYEDAIKYALGCGIMTETVCKQFENALKA